MPQSARLSEGGGGGNRYLGNAQIDPAFFYLGLPLGKLNILSSDHLSFFIPMLVALVHSQSILSPETTIMHYGP